MKRRDFLRTAAMGAVGALAAPYILPSGTLFARTGSRKVNHVVFALFAGGVRNIESVRQQEGGNLMRNLLSGSPSNIPGLDPLPGPIQTPPLQTRGTLYREMRYAQGPTGHFNGHTVAVTGAYTNTGLNLAENPMAPTIFEYYRKHTGPSESALNAWWVSDTLGPYVALNYSQHPQYGAAFGGNFLSISAFPFSGQLDLSRQAAFNDAEHAQIAAMRGFLNDSFPKDLLAQNLSMVNTPEDAERLRSFISDTYRSFVSGGFNNPLGVPNSVANSDIYNVALAERILSEFEPELLVVNMQAIDAGHQNFTQYCNNIRKADHAVAHLWQHIQRTPGMRDDTLLVIAPEHGRNLEPNSLVDAYGKAALDHTSDATSREIFALLVGPSSVVDQGATIGTVSGPRGESIDLVPTIADALGFLPDIPGGLLMGQSLIS